MSAKNNTPEGGQEKNLPKTTVQTIPQNLTAIQSLPTVQNIQNVQSGTSSTLQGIQTAPAVTGQATLVGKSISLELNPKLLVKSSGSTSIGIADSSKIASAFCGPVRIINPNMLPTIERSTQPQGQQSTSQTQQIVTTIGNFHVPLGPAAVANISAPRGAPLVRAISTSQTIPISRPSVSTTVPSTQWQAKNTSVVYAPAQQQQQRHPVPVVNRAAGSARPIVYASSQQSQQQQSQAQNQPAQSQVTQSQPRLVSPSQVGRSIQATVVTATPSRLITPVIQTQNNNITARLPSSARPATPQIVTSLPQSSQGARPVTQIIQPNQTSRPMTTTPVNRVAVTPPVIGVPNKVATVTSVPTSAVRQVTINTAASAAGNQHTRIIIPQNIQPQQQSQSSQPPSASRIVQAVTSLASFNQASRVISTSAGTAGNAPRLAQAGTSVARITGLSLHPIPINPAPASRATPPSGTHKVTSQATVGIQQVTSKPGPTVTIQPQPQQQHQQQQPQLPQQQQISMQRTIGNVSSGNVVATSAPGQQSTQIQGQYLHQPHATTYYSIDASGAYSQYRPASVQQPVRLLVEQQGYEQEPTPKPNASPRPSILRKREHDNSPGKVNMSLKTHPLNTGVVKNLVPVLAAMSSSSVHSPPGSPKTDRDGGGNHSSGSTTVSATSSPGLDEEPEQSRITINPTVEMSPRKKPRKQQLTGVELIEPRCTEEMQFITEEKIKKEIKEESKERKHNVNPQDFKTPQPAPVRTKPVPSLIGSSWKNQWSGRLHHYRRPSDVRPREERRPSVNDIAQQKHVLQKVNGWKVYHLTSQMEDFAETERTVHEKLKATLTMLESQQKNRQDQSLERANELIKGNMQRSNLISEGMNEARVQLTAIFQHKTYVTDLLQRCGSKRSQKKR